MYVQHKVVDLEGTVDRMKVLRNIPILTTSETSDGLSVVSSKLGSMSPVRNAENNTGDLIDNMTLMLPNCHSHFNCCIISVPRCSHKPLCRL